MTATAGKTYPLVTWQGAQSCTGRVAPGAAALLAWHVANRPAPPERSMGIYNCRTVVGGSTTSLHGEGRALDWGVFPLDNGKGSGAGHELVDLLLSSADVLGIQCIIYDRTIWSARSPGGRRYTGAHPHYDHLHIELSWVSARTLTLNRLVEVLGGTAEKPPEVPDVPDSPKPPPPNPPDPTPAPPAPDPDPKVVDLMKRVDLSDVTRNSSTFVRGPEVGVLQAGLLADGYGPDGLVGRNGRPDSVGGPATRRLLGLAQTKHRTGFRTNPSRPDFVAGPATYRALFVK